MSSKFALIGLYSPAPQSGKSTAALFLQQSRLIKRCSRLSFATPLKMMSITFFECIGYSEIEAQDLVFNRKEDVVPEINKTSRYVQQTLGTEWGRNLIGQDLWVKAMQGQVERHREQGISVAIDDVRFFNEAQMIKSLGGQVWKIMRPGLIPPRDHASEGSLNNWDGFDHVIMNDGTVQDLREKIDALLKDAG